MPLSSLRAKIDALRFHAREAALVLRGQVPPRFVKAKYLAASRADLAAARAETGRLAALLALTQEKLAAAQAETGRWAAQFAGALAPGEGGAPLNPRLAVVMPEAILEGASAEPFKVIDVGAQILEWEDHVYAELVRKLRGQVVGFEPLEDEREARAGKEKNVVMLPHAIGRGGSAVLRTTKFNPASSLLEPNVERLKDFLALPEMLEVASETTLETKSLDGIPEAAGCRFLKIDVQGGELDVLKGATSVLGDTLAIYAEIEFVDIYRNQPRFCEVNAYLEERGFELLDLMNPGYGSYRAASNGELQSRLLWVDGFYVRRPDAAERLSRSKLLQLACAAHFVGAKYDYAAHVLSLCDREYGTSYLEAYSENLRRAVALYKDALRAGPGA